MLRGSPLSDMMACYSVTYGIATNKQTTARVDLKIGKENSDMLFVRGSPENGVYGLHFSGVRLTSTMDFPGASFKNKHGPAL